MRSPSPGEPRELLRVGCGNLDQMLRLTDDPHDRAVVEHEAVAVPERGSVWKIEQEGGAALAGEHDAPSMALVRVEHDTVNDQSFIDAIGAANG
jgi:hypothetical protein